EDPSMRIAFNSPKYITIPRMPPSLIIKLEPFPSNINGISIFLANFTTSCTCCLFMGVTKISAVLIYSVYLLFFICLFLYTCFLFCYLTSLRTVLVDNLRAIQKNQHFRIILYTYDFLTVYL